MGLNDNYVVIHGNILMSHPMPEIGQALSMVLQEDRQRDLQISAPWRFFCPFLSTLQQCSTSKTISTTTTATTLSFVASST